MLEVEVAEDGIMITAEVAADDMITVVVVVAEDEVMIIFEVGGETFVGEGVIRIAEEEAAAVGEVTDNKRTGVRPPRNHPF